MSPSIHVSACQFAPGSDPASNRQKVAELVLRSVDTNARVVVFPEYSNYFTAPFDARMKTHAEPLDGPFVQHLQALAAQHDVTIAAGILESTADAERPFNTAVAVNAAGIAAVYRKQHLYNAFGNRESDWITQGPFSAPQTFEVDGVRLGMITCYDLRFPEAMRVVIDAGADAVLVPAEWVSGPLKEHHWRTLLAARAIENTVFVVASNHPAPIGVGLSQVIAPDGTVMASVSTANEAIASATLHLTELVRTRSANPALRLRRYRVTEAH